MMKVLAYSCISLALSCGIAAVPTHAQTNTFPGSGSAGINTTSPTAPLDVRLPSGTSGERIRFDGAAYGLGVFNLGSGFDATVGMYANEGYSGGHVALGLMDGSTFEPALLVHHTGNVGIGYNSPSYKLAVNGTIKAKEILVDTSGWSDFVFDPTYELPSLTATDEFIKRNRHLPGIPSEAEVKEKGVSVGDMTSRLLARIEELTLHMIRLNRETTHLRQAQRKASRVAARRHAARSPSARNSDEG